MLWSELFLLIAHESLWCHPCLLACMSAYLREILRHKNILDATASQDFFSSLTHALSKLNGEIHYTEDYLNEKHVQCSHKTRLKLDHSKIMSNCKTWWNLIHRWLPKTGLNFKLDHSKIMNNCTTWWNSLYRKLPKWKTFSIQAQNKIEIGPFQNYEQLQNMVIFNTQMTT